MVHEILRNFEQLILTTLLAAIQPASDHDFDKVDQLLPSSMGPLKHQDEQPVYDRMSVNLQVLEVPQLVGLSGIFFQHDGVGFTWTSRRSNSAISLKFDPDNATLRKVNDEDRVNEPEATKFRFTLTENEPEGRLFRMNDFVTVRSKELLVRGSLEGAAVVGIAEDEK